MHRALSVSEPQYVTAADSGFSRVAFRRRLFGRLTRDIRLCDVDRGYEFDFCCTFLILCPGWSPWNVPNCTTYIEEQSSIEIRLIVRVGGLATLFQTFSFSLGRNEWWMIAVFEEFHSEPPAQYTKGLTWRWTYQRWIQPGAITWALDPQLMF